MYIGQERVEVYGITRLKEYAGPGRYLYAYVVQVQLPKGVSKDDYIRLSLSVADRETAEKGAACAFFRLARDRSISLG